ncbi:MAG: glycosyltransferase family 1 protein [Chloroflexota bacterium]
MHLIIDGLVYENKTQGGIARIYREILPRLCALEPSLKITLLAGHNRQATLPQHPHIQQELLPTLPTLPLPVPFWGRLQRWRREQALAQAVMTASTGLWHTTYYTMPPPLQLTPRIVTVYDMLHEQFPNFFNSRADDRFRQQKKQVVQQADAILAISETAKRDLCEAYRVPSKRVSVTPLAASDVFQRLPAEKPLYKRPFLLYVGNRIHYKNFSGLLTAFAAWPRRAEFDLLVVGRPFSSLEQRQLAELGVAEQVVLASTVMGKTAVSDQLLCQLYNQARAFVYPSLGEGFGIPLLEAIACGCPIVASRIPTTEEVAGSYPTYFDPTDSHSLIDALDVAVRQGRQVLVSVDTNVLQRYSWNLTAQLTLKRYRELL